MHKLITWVSFVFVEQNYFGRILAEIRVNDRFLCVCVGGASDRIFGIRWGIQYKSLLLELNL